ncbi:cyanoexosortase A [Lyngbya confervoides]|uniref:Cyanoexosortase A n=1 Tax=Lyngbya confervoides BDU141951 TaxID=1574623 RepID=A0ABD4SY28_9CYAN|nr:cyanoexosortase A [Lyngbya confervoides]MCM1981262.1 cyanoexosortase A [Lyngbya confervoides BDU141951]
MMTVQDQSIRIPWVWLVGLAGGLLFIHLALDLQRKSYGHLSISLLFWIAVFTLLSERQAGLKFGSNWLSLGCGAGLLVALVARSIAVPGGRILGFYPFVALLGLGLMASGFRYLGQYRQELIGLFFLGFPQLISLKSWDISPLTARLSSWMLWYSGFPVLRQGTYISLFPSGGVKVVPECSGLNLMLYMFGVSVVFLMLFPRRGKQRLILPLLAVSLGFLINGVRVALLAFLSAANNPQAFDYWHSQEGAFVFVLLAVGVFSGLCWLSFRVNSPKK